MDECTARLAGLLRRHRRARGLSQEELAGRAAPSLSLATVSNIERGRTLPYRHTVEALVAGLGLNGAQRDELIALWRAAAAAREPAGGAPPPRRHPLPAALTSFVGRAEELAHLGGLLTGDDQTSRLITLFGPPGTGKTRLAMQVARSLVDAFDGRVAFVPLASTSDPAQVAAAIEEALGIPDPRGASPVGALKEHLHDGRWLLVLDNLEQVVGSGPLVVELLAACPELRVLATSREALHVTGEQVFPVPPLTLPDRAHAVTADAVWCSEAGALFVERARAVFPAFALDEVSTPAVAELCHRLDGLPLAIELAAGRVGTLPPAALVARLEAGGPTGALALLAGGPRDLPSRQRALRDAIEWSHDLLAPEERALFRRLGIFEGGFTLEAAEAVCGASPADVVDALASLAAKSLVQRVRGGPNPRFAMLETLRAYALGRLAAAGDEEQARAVHADWLVAFVERGESALYTPERDAWVERVAAEYDNLRAALRWLVERDDHGSAELAERILTSLAQLSALAMVPECCRWAERLATRRDPPTPVRARFLANAYLFALYQGDVERVRGWIDDAVSTARAAGEPRPLADALFAAAHLAQLFGRNAEAARMFEESVALYQPTGVEEGRLGMSLLGLGIARTREDPAAADALLAEALALYRRRGSWFGVALARNAFGQAAVINGAPAGACDHFMAGLRLCREHDDRWTAAYVLSSMMPALAEVGDASTALPLIEQLLSVASDLSLPYYARSALASLERLVPWVSADGPAAALYARFAEVIGPTPA